MQQKIIYFTQKGLEEKQKEYENLLSERPDAVKDLSKARDMGDLSENGYYKSAKFKLSDIDRRLRQIKHVLKVARVKDTTSSTGIDIGSVVTIENEQGEKTYTIVGTYESNPSLNKISLDSPLGRALFGKKVGEKAVYFVGDNKIEITVLKVM